MLTIIIIVFLVYKFYLFLLKYFEKNSNYLPDVIITNIHSKYSGVTTTIKNLYLEQKKEVDIGIFGSPISNSNSRVSLIDIFYYGYQLPKNKKFRIIHTRRNNEILFSLILKYIFRIPLKIIFTSVKISKFSIIPTFLVSKVDNIIVTQKKCIDFLPKKSNIVGIIPHGIDIKYFTNNSNEITDDYYNLKNKFVISCFGRVRSLKGVDIFVKALIKVLPKYTNIIGLIVGNNDVQDIFFKNNLLSLIKTNKLEDRIIFTGFISSITDCEYIFNNTNLCVCVPRYEGFGLTPIEAMACGIPVIASDTGYFSNIIENRKNGIVIPVNDIDSLCKELIYYIENKNLLLEMKDKCINKVNNNFSIERESKSINLIYNKIWNF